MIARWSITIPGSVESLEVRAQDPDGPFSEPLLALHDGRYPTAPGEVAVTDGVAELLQARRGGTVDIDGQRRRVVGVIENPSDLHEEFALVPATELDAAESVTILIGGTGAFDEVAALRDFGDDYLPNADITSRQGEENASSSAAVAVLGTATVAMVMVSLIAAAGFVVVAQRRQRQLGMLGSDRGDGEAPAVRGGGRRCSYWRRCRAPSASRSACSAGWSLRHGWKRPLATGSTHGPSPGGWSPALPRSP